MTVATAMGLFAAGIACFSRAGLHRRQAEGQQATIRALAAGLPAHWYILSDIRLTPVPGEPDVICMVVVSPGALVVIRICSEGGELVPAGSVWMAGRGRRARMIPSPATACQAAAEALRGLLMDADSLPVIPLVVLTAPDGVYYPSRAGAYVVGLPHAASAVRYCGSGAVFAPDAAHRLAMDLCQFYR